MKNIIIAIDGHAGSGKSSTAKEVAKQLKYKYINSGIIYRAICYYIYKEEIDIYDEESINNCLDDIEIDICYNEESLEPTILLNHQDISEKTHYTPIEQRVAQISTFYRVREKALDIQKNLADGGGVVVEGRDIGTKVFPNAELKIFMTGDLKVRALRRYEQLRSKSHKVDLTKLITAMEERDHIDQNRSINPLIKSEDAVVIDTTSMIIDEQVAEILNLAYNRINSLD